MLPRWVIFVSGGHMRYSKPALSVEDQARLLISRGMRGDVAEIASRLAVVSYYRLSGYWYQFRKADSDNLIDGIEFSRVWELYAFDRELRLLVMDPIERVEVFVRTQLAHFHALASAWTMSSRSSRRRSAG